MVKKEKNLLRLLLFLPIFLFSSETFILPDETDHLMHTMNKEIKGARNQIYFITPHLNDHTFIKTIKRVAKKGILVTIITEEPLQPDNQVSRLTLFNNMEVFTLKPFNQSEKIQGSLICIDNHKLFMLNSDIDNKKMKNSYSFATYSQEACNDLFYTLLERSTPY